MRFLKNNKTIALLILTLALFGFADATYLTIEHFTGGIIRCGLTGGCDVVTTSVYSTMFGIPIALLGALYYFSLIFGIMAYFDARDERLLYWLGHYAVVGFVFSVVLVVLQVFFLKSICIYCMGSALSSTLIYYLGHQVHKKYKV
jgi:uncharacterized membrane protein